MKITIRPGDNLPEGEYELTGREKLENALGNLSHGRSDREKLLEYDRIGGRVAKDGIVLPPQSLWNQEQQHMNKPVDQFTDAELLVVIRRSENTDIPGSLYQRASTEWQIRHQQATLNAMKEGGKSSFVKIAPGAQVTGLTMAGNTMVGDGDFLLNEGELSGAILENNRHIAQATAPIADPKKWYERPLGMLLLTIAAGLIVAYLVFRFGWM